MPGLLFDCYVLAPERTAKFALRFLDRFLPEREPSFALEDPAEVLSLPPSSPIEDVLLYLEQHPTSAYSMYWRSRSGSDPYHAIVAFNDDGSLVLGLSPATDDHPDVARGYLRDLERYAGTEPGLLLFEQPPPDSRADFEAMIHPASTQPGVAPDTAAPRR
jgi:hypothetical protein